MQYYLYIGTTRGGRQIYSGNQGRATTRVVNGLPTNGSTIYVRLWTRTTAGWRYHDYTYRTGRTDDHGNSTATATAIALPSTTAGVINYAGDNDYFRVVVPSSGVLTVNTTGATDTFGYLLSSTGSIIASNDDAGGALRTNFRISRTVTAGTYYIRVRHFSNAGTGAYHLVSNFTTGGTGTISVMTSPTPGSTLTSATVTFRWTNVGAVQYYLYVGTTRGGRQIYSGNQGRATSRVVNGLPTNGSTIYVRLWTRTTAGWRYHDYTYRTGRTDDHGNSTATATAITLPSTTAGVINYAGDNDYFRVVVPSSGVLTVNTTGATDTFGYLLSSTGSIIASNDDAGGALRTNFRISRTVTAGTYYIRVRHFSNAGTGAYHLVSNFTTGGTGTISVMTSPTPGSTLTSATVAFRWTNVGAVQYYLYVGTTRGGRQIYSGNQGRATSRVVSGLPTNGSTIYVRLWTRTAAGWRYHDYTYRATTTTGIATMIFPTQGSTLHSAIVTFSWNATGASQYYLYVGTTRGGRQIYSGNQGRGTSRTVSGLPVNGSIVYVRLWTRTSAGWRFRDYTYHAFTGSAQAYHFVLTWGATPRDLDFHVTGPTANNSATRFHTYYRSRTNNGVSLDVDDTTSYGPETITVQNWFIGTYRFSVHDFTNRTSTTSAAMGNSGRVTIRAYSPTGLIGTYHMPRRPGTLWTAFEVRVTTAGVNVVPVNAVTYVSNPISVRSTSGQQTDSSIIQADLIKKR